MASRQANCDANFDEVDKKLWLYMVTITNISTLIGLHVLNTEQTFFLYNVGLNKITGILFAIFCLEILL